MLGNSESVSFHQSCQALKLSSLIFICEYCDIFSNFFLTKDEHKVEHKTILIILTQPKFRKNETHFQIYNSLRVISKVDLAIECSFIDNRTIGSPDNWVLKK